MKMTVESDRLLAAAGGIRDIVELLRDNMDAMEVLVNSLNGEWQGEAERACAGRFFCMRREFKEVERFFEEYASLLGRFAEEHRDFEEKMTARIRNA